MHELYNLGVKGLIANNKKEYLLLKVSATRLRNVKNDYWDLPGGRVIHKESVTKTLNREVGEETGLKIARAKPLGMVLSNIRIPIGNNWGGLILAIYECSTERASNVRLSKEHIEYGWFTPKDAAKLLKVKYPPELTKLISRISS